MPLQIYNTLTRRKGRFTPIVAGQVKMYVCGPTVYDDPHLGHARSAVIFDVIRRYLEVRGCSVTQVRNVTDIDDKIIEKARRQNRDFKTLGAHYLHRYEQSMKCLGVLPPHFQPRATAFIGPIQEMIARLQQRGHAYAADGSVYFAVKSFKDYGKLSRRTCGAAVQDTNASPDGPAKRHPADFALWKAAKPGEPFWPSPWGPGRPGWHIECTAMSARLLGEQCDIHGGGEDLIFPHHENGIAQSESLFEKPPAVYWMHHGLVHLNGCKISKSKGNFRSLNDMLVIYPPAALRLFLLSRRYRRPMAFDHGKMKNAVKNMVRLHRFFLRCNLSLKAITDGEATRGSVWKRFCRAMDDDFNFPEALSAVFKSVRAICRTMNGLTGACGAPRLDHYQLHILDLYAICEQVLGLGITSAETAERKNTNEPVAGTSGGLVEKMVVT